MFEPWIGSNFGSPDHPVGRHRLMILGESHYSTDPSLIGTAPKSFTSEVVRSLAIESGYPFFGKLRAAVVGGTAGSGSFAERASFWSGVVFYNYVPVIVDGRPLEVGGTARRPTTEMFKAGAGAFRVVQHDLKPAAIIVCGLELWSHVAATLAGIKQPTRDVVFFDDGNSVFSRIHHPSWRGFKLAQWQTRVQHLLRLAATPRQTGNCVLWSDGEEKFGKLSPR